MAPRPRKRGNKDLPTNLYPTQTGYSYKHPLTGKRHGMGSDRGKAIAAANILNQKLMPKSDLVMNVIGEKTIRGVIGRFRKEYLPEREYSERTAAEVEIRLKRIERELGNEPWIRFGLKELSDWLTPLPRAAYIKFRHQWIEIYRFACSVELAQQNLAEMTLAKKAAAKKRKRWTPETYKATWDRGAPWLQVAMDFAITSLQRREDLVRVRKREDFVDGRLLVRQKKTGKRLAITPAGDLAAVIERAKALHPFCPFLIAREPERDIRGQKEHPYQVTEGYLSKAVAAARDKAMLEEPELFAQYKGKSELPTLHELRAFGGWLYEEAGFPAEYIQALYGHTNAKMTTHYLDGHEEKWEEVSAGLVLN